MAVPISQLVPNLSDLVNLPVEELGGVLLVHLNSYIYGESPIAQHNKLNRHAFFDDLWKQPEYLDGRDVIRTIFLEAWAWLETEGLLAPTLDNGDAWFFVTRRGKRIKSGPHFEAYRKGNLLPKHQIHPVVAQEVYSIFLSGKYDTAIFEAFRQVEIAVRHGGQFPQNFVGENLMREAFKPVKNNLPAGPLTDPELPVAEQEGMAHLFAGAFAVYRNSTGHRYVSAEPEQTAEVIMFASQLLRTVDRLILKNTKS